LIREVQSLKQKGVSDFRIAKSMKMAPKTVRKYSSGDPAVLAESGRPAFIKQEPFQEEIISLINNKILRKDIFRSVVNKGYDGGPAQFYRYCKHLAEIGAVGSSGNLRIGELCDGQTKPIYHYVTRNQIFNYVWMGDSDISKDDMDVIKKTFPVVNELKQCLYKFRNIFEKKSKEALMEYIETYKNCELEQIKNNAKSIEKDIEPITNAVVEEYSNGFVEGTNNKLKLIKRIAYGRCKIPLLKAKVLLPNFF